MLGNRRRDTKPELTLRSALHAGGLRFRKDYRLDLEGLGIRPDIVFTRAKVAVFMDGCFWHCCPTHGTQPSRNSDYWAPKLARNVQRDREQDAALARSGWRVVRIWAHETLEEAVERVTAELAGYQPRSRHSGRCGRSAPSVESPPCPG